MRPFTHKYSVRFAASRADHDQPGSRSQRLHRFESAQHERNVLFRRQSTDVQEYRIIGHRAPGLSQMFAALCRREPLCIHTPAHDRQPLEAAVVQAGR
jgi:hypothetical protein